MFIKVKEKCVTITEKYKKLDKICKKFVLSISI